MFSIRQYSLRTSKHILRRPNSVRLLSTNPPVTLDYQLHSSTDAGKQDEPILILHGLFGSKRNWNTIAKTLCTSLGRKVFALDLRNHGTSPHVSSMTYREMAQDVLEFIHKHNLERTTVIGHSMGGKVAMSLALDPVLDNHPDLLKKLIILDIAPVKGKLSEEFEKYIETMQKIERANLKTRKEAGDIFAEVEKDPFIRAFLLTNLQAPTSERPYVKFRLPIHAISNSMMDIGDFPYTAGERTWEGRTMVLKGERSAYINRHNIPLIERFFPNHQLETIDTGHWVHAERPEEFRKLVVDFINEPADEF